MPRRWVLCLLMLTGCSTHPISDLEDYFHPGKIGPNKVLPYGGVCIPQGPVTGAGPSLPSVPAIAVPVVPPAAPLPPPAGAPITGPPAPSIFPGR
jgi:hypothetical protein